MKKIALIGLMGLMVGGALAADNVITNYLPAYREVTTACTNAGDTGLSTGVTYFCFNKADVAQLTEAQGSHTNGSFSQLLYAITEAFQSGWSAHASTNLPTKATISRQTMITEGADYAIIHRVTTLVTGSVSIVTE